MPFLSKSPAGQWTIRPATRARVLPAHCVMLARGFFAVVRGNAPLNFFNPSNHFGPDLSPVEMALAKLKTQTRKATAKAPDNL